MLLRVLIVAVLAMGGCGAPPINDSIQEFAWMGGSELWIAPGATPPKVDWSILPPEAKPSPDGRSILVFREDRTFLVRHPWWRLDRDFPLPGVTAAWWANGGTMIGRDAQGWFYASSPDFARHYVDGLERVAQQGNTVAILRSRGVREWELLLDGKTLHIPRGTDPQRNTLILTESHLSHSWRDDDGRWRTDVRGRPGLEVVASMDGWAPGRFHGEALLLSDPSGTRGFRAVALPSRARRGPAPSGWFFPSGISPSGRYIAGRRDQWLSKHLNPVIFDVRTGSSYKVPASARWLVYPDPTGEHDSSDLLALAEPESIAPSPSLIQVRFALVTIEPQGVEHATPLRGILLSDGSVLAPMHALRTATGATIITSGGVRLETNGIIGFEANGNALLLRLAWKEPPLEGLSLGLGPPLASAAWLVRPEGDPVAVRFDDSLQGLGGRAFHTVDAPVLDRTWAGLPLVDGQGRLAGAVTGTAWGVALRIGEAGGYARFTSPTAEQVGALRLHEFTTWDQWRQRQQQRVEAIALANNAWKQYRSGANLSAIAQSNQAIELDRHCWQAWHALVYAQWSSDPSAALAATEELNALRPGHAHELAHQSLLLASVRGRYAEAESLARTAIAYNPKSANAQYALARALQYSGSYRDAMDHYAEALRLDPSHAASRKELDILQVHPRVTPR